MILLLPPTAPLISHIALAVALTSSLAPAPVQNIPVLEVIKVYGKLAGPECYGLKAPPGSSCQIQRQGFERELSLESKASKLSRDEFASKLEQLDFQWPLKPYGIDKSLAKTVVMNKGAETRVFMDELESRGLYDKRNPTGPLPSSLRSVLNLNLQKEGLDARAVEIVFRAFTVGSREKELSTAQVDGIFQGRDTLDYYEFLKVVGTDAIMWPN